MLCCFFYSIFCFHFYHEQEEQEKEEQEKKEGAVDASLEKPTPEAEDVTFSHIVHDLASEASSRWRSSRMENHENVIACEAFERGS